MHVLVIIEVSHLQFVGSGDGYGFGDYGHGGYGYGGYGGYGHGGYGGGYGVESVGIAEDVGGYGHGCGNDYGYGLGDGVVGCASPCGRSTIAYDGACGSHVRPTGIME